MGDELTQSEPFGAVVFSPDGSLLISGAEMPYIDDASLSVRVWEVATGDLLAELDGHFENYNDIAISPDGRVIATAGGGFACGECPSQDGAIRLWGVKAGGE
jgi:WD40 repeat protein